MLIVLTTLVLLVFLALAGGVGYLWLRLRETSRREALQALAARRGWGLSITEERLGRPGMLRLAPRGGPAWAAETRRLTPGPAGHPAALVTEFASEDPRLAEGLLVVAPALAPAAETSLDAAAARDLIAQRPGLDSLAHAGELALWPAPAAITVLCTFQPSPRFDLGDLAKLWAAWGGDPRRQPVVQLGPEGLRIHLPVGVIRADQMEKLIDFAHDLGRIL